MRKPVSKHALRRALEQVRAEGRLQVEEPLNTVVDQLWHHLEKEAFNGARKTAPRNAARRRETVEA
ncbi:MAG TPA: hypothetical protein VFX98_07640 [Longimicrobiaceae bacterium]|nr:hypothetical protein [Longimicrobiaceae bacterium]